MENTRHWRNRRPSGFTLVELLVVISIVALLVSILLPTFRTVRKQAKRTVCGTNLRQIGVAMQGYMNGHGDRFPAASFFPSIGPMPLPGPDSVFIADVLGDFLSRDDDVFACPADLPGRTPREPPYAGQSYFQ